MASTKTGGRPARSGIPLPFGTSRSRGWSWFRETRRRHLLFRAGVFTVGLLLLLLGAALWLFSALLCLPPVFLGLWLWSREFHWGHRLFRRFLGTAASLWERVRARPVRWAVFTAAGAGAAWAGSWAWGHYSPWGLG